MSISSQDRRTVDIVVVTGMSGSGRSTAINALEDEGYYCIDNLPTALIPGFVDLCSASDGEMGKVALGLDLRDESYIEKWPAVRTALESGGHKVKIVFVDASDSALLRRYSETRRAHPLGHGLTLMDAIKAEREALSPVKDATPYAIDTTNMTVHDLKRRMRDFVSGRSDISSMLTTITSFGHKYGTLENADLLFDVRFLPNPHFVDELRSKTGLDPDVASYVLDRPETERFLKLTYELLEFVLPQYAREGRAYLTIGVGCTGGRHRSVAIAEAVAKKLGDDSMSVIVRHRDSERKQG